MMIFHDVNLKGMTDAENKKADARRKIFNSIDRTPYKEGKMLLLIEHLSMLSVISHEVKFA